MSEKILKIGIKSFQNPFPPFVRNVKANCLKIYLRVKIVLMMSMYTIFIRMYKKFFVLFCCRFFFFFFVMQVAHYIKTVYIYTLSYRQENLVGG